jgi:hypothetical protein
VKVDPVAEETSSFSEEIESGGRLSLKSTPAQSIANCTDLPTFSSGSDVPTATEHDERALAENPDCR